MKPKWYFIRPSTFVQVTLLAICLYALEQLKIDDVWTSDPSEKGFLGQDRLNIHNCTVLITGIAGFVGFSLASALAKAENRSIVGIDSFTDFYDVKLKYQRADLLSRYRNVEIHRGDVCDAEFLARVLASRNFTHVVHLAAQPGVRHSLRRPFEYIRENIQCFLTLLEALRAITEDTLHDRVPRLIYASSSSVYGSNQVPFKEADRVDRPTSLYSVSKRTNELMAYAYNHLFGITSTGLRFFTVYGPWGRPDMAPYQFTESVEKGANITLFNGGNMGRDFTYIDDIVAGIIGAMGYDSSSRSVVFNLGNGKLEPVRQLVGIIENILGKTSLINFQDSRSDISETLASIEKAQHLLGYQPRTDLVDGMQEFILWFLVHSGSRSICASECSDPSACVKTNIDTALQQSKALTHGCDVVVYTAYMSNVWNDLPDAPAQDLETSDLRYCYIAFSNVEEHTRLEAQSMGPAWKVIYVRNADPINWWDSRRISRIFKLTPARFFAESVRYAIYVDAKLNLIANPQTLIGMMDDADASRRAVLAAYRHPSRSDPFSEAKAVMESKGGRPEVSFSLWTMAHQIEQYKSHLSSQNLTLHNLIDGAILVHDLNHPCAKEFRCAWTKEYYQYSDRDQISFPYVLSVQTERDVKLDQNQEWCPLTCATGDQTKVYVRILSERDHWENGSDKIAVKRHIKMMEK